MKRKSRLRPVGLGKRKRRIRPRSAKRQLEEYLDDLLHDLVVDRDGQCMKCGKAGPLVVSHIYPKGKFPAMRYLLPNVKALCHLPCHEAWWHRHPIDAALWAHRVLGEDRMRNLAVIASQPGRVDRQADRIYLEAQMAKRGLPLPFYEPKIVSRKARQYREKP